MSWISDFFTGSAGTLLGSGVNALSNLFTNASNERSVNATNEANARIAQQTNATNIQLAEQNNAANMALNRENIAFQQNENAITRAREDNAVQRRAADLARAGLSKTLAAGSAASANALQAPQNSISNTAPSLSRYEQRAFQRAAFNANLESLNSVGLNVQQLRQNIESSKIENDARKVDIAYQKAILEHLNKYGSLPGTSDLANTLALFESIFSRFLPSQSESSTSSSGSTSSSSSSSSSSSGSTSSSSSSNGSSKSTSKPNLPTLPSSTSSSKSFNQSTADVLKDYRDASPAQRKAIEAAFYDAFKNKSSLPLSNLNTKNVSEIASRPLFYKFRY